MSRYRVLIERGAEKDLKFVSSDLYDRILGRHLRSRGSPAAERMPQLVGTKNDWRIRVGDYRVVYEIVDRLREVRVNRVRHRREVYR